MEQATVEKRPDEMTEENSLNEMLYHSVEFHIGGFNCPYQFKVRKKPCGSMHVLVRENSDILKGLKVGNRLNLKYYSDDFDHTAMYRTTEIMDIARVYEGRFRGHYTVGLSIVEQNENIISN